ncbi:MAG: hypothetical protein JKY34_01970 [Kordiimonadaceae bacterium]|nr:hypothetical protein [Kordiimonadaceae bacterium]
MPVFFRFLSLILTLVAVIACSPSTDSLEQAKYIGTKAIIKAHGNELLLEVTGYADNILTSEIFDWNGNFVSRRHYYNGLYPVAGTEGSSQWEMDFDVKKIDALFPLVIGKSTNITGNMKDIDNDKSYDFWAHIEVVAKKIFLLPSGEERVYVIKISTEYDWNGRSKRTMETVYYSPDLNMNLKGVMHEHNAQKYWRVTSIEKPGSAKAKNKTRSRRPRSGTVLI